MTEPTSGTQILSPVICPGSTSHYSTGGAGGYHELPSLTRRDTLPVDAANRLHYDGMGSGHRRQGMLVVITSDADPVKWPTYRLQVPSYATLTEEQKVVGLANNANWKPYAPAGAGNPSSGSTPGSTPVAGAPIPTTHRALELLRKANALGSVGTKYLIQDFRSTQTFYATRGGMIVEGYRVLGPDQYNYAPASESDFSDPSYVYLYQPIIVEAVSANEFSTKAQLAFNKNDIVEYIFKPKIENASGTVLGRGTFPLTSVLQDDGYTLINTVVLPQTFYDKVKTPTADRYIVVRHEEYEGSEEYEKNPINDTFTFNDANKSVTFETYGDVALLAQTMEICFYTKVYIPGQIVYRANVERNVSAPFDFETCHQVRTALQYTDADGVLQTTKPIASAAEAEYLEFPGGVTATKVEEIYKCFGSNVDYVSNVNIGRGIKDIVLTTDTNHSPYDINMANATGKCITGNFSSFNVIGTITDLNVTGHVSGTVIGALNNVTSIGNLDFSSFNGSATNTVFKKGVGDCLFGAILAGTSFEGQLGNSLLYGSYTNASEPADILGVSVYR